MAHGSVRGITHVDQVVAWVDLDPVTVEHDVQGFEWSVAYGESDTLLCLVLRFSGGFYYFDNDDFVEVLRDKHVGGTGVSNSVGVAILEREGILRFVSETNALQESRPEEVFVDWYIYHVFEITTLHQIFLRWADVDVRIAFCGSLHMEGEFAFWDFFRLG